MSNSRAKFLGFLLIIVISMTLANPAAAQRELSGEAKIRLALEKLNVLGSVLMIAAHPDDENTALLAYFARGRTVRTGYLALTRGEGGQNLIGPERGDLLGLIRTQELMQARKIDGAEQFFTRAIDFGFTKSAQETLSKWGRETILSDVVWTIRSFRPDVIVLVFTGTPRDGHGQHQSSAILAKEAFTAAADESKFPEQLKWVEPWQAKRILWNVFYWSSDRDRLAKKYPERVRIDTGEFNPILGYSYAEIAGMSRSKHRSQGFGAPERKGSFENYLVTVAGDPARKDVFDGIDITWNRLQGGSAVGGILSEAAQSFRPEEPEKTVPLLLRARPLIAAIKDPWASRKLAELDETIALCTGLWLDASSEQYNVAPGDSMKVDLVALNRSHFPIQLTGIAFDGMQQNGPAEDPPAVLEYNRPLRRERTIAVPASQPYSEPYWLRKPRHGDVYEVDDRRLEGQPESPPALCARFLLNLDGRKIALVRPVAHRYVDRARGELVRPLEIVPPVAVNMSQPVVMFPSAAARETEVLLVSNVAGAAGEVKLEAPRGWQVEPAARPFHLSGVGEEAGLLFKITPPAASTRGEVRAVASLGGKEISSGMTVVSYPHIPPQTVFPPAQAEMVRAGIRILAHRIGYVMGAGDEIPDALRQLGCEVTLLSSEDLVRSDLHGFDAIVTGVRAFNVRADLRGNFQRLLDYAHSGGTLVVQYNVLPYRGQRAILDKIGPYPIRISHGRVSVEEAPVTFLKPGHPLLESPNKITAADFEGWVQERGLYFASEWDSRYEPLFASHDPGENPLPGGTLYARYGKGAYIFTAYSWFRQLPAGVPGAYRIFANLLSAAKSVP